VQRSADALDVVAVAIPALEPEFIILPARIAGHVHEHRRQFVGQPQHALRARQFASEEPDRRHREAQTWRYHIEAHMNFLSVKGVNPKYNTSGAQKPTYEVCDIAKKFTVQIYCKGISPKTATGSAGPLVLSPSDVADFGAKF
jgi:hypothetical protein